MKNQMVILIALIVCLSCNDKKRNITGQSIQELAFFTRTDSVHDRGALIIDQTRHYVIDKSVDGDERDTLIKRFVYNFKPDNIDSLRFNLVFYKESDITNQEHLQKDRRDLDRYSQENDLIWNYVIDKGGKLITGTKYKSGEIVYPKPIGTIKVEDVK